MTHRYCVRAMSLAVSIALGLAVFGCSGSSIDGQGGPELTVVEGVVTEVVDQVPVDGGVTITIRTTGGKSRTVYFESMFTYPPPSNEHVALYEKVRVVKVGNRVRATGTPKDDYVSLKDIEVLR